MDISIGITYWPLISILSCELKEKVIEISVQLCIPDVSVSSKQGPRVYVSDSQKPTVFIRN